MAETVETITTAVTTARNALVVAATDADTVISANKASMNRLINVYDPPKDLSAHKNEDQNLTGNESIKQVLKPILKELFSPTKALPAGFNPVGDAKGTLQTEVETVLGGTIATKVNNTKILRETHSSGHDPKPDGLFVSQDAGPADVVSNPTFIITPGVIIDPATKTTSGDNVSRLTTGTYATLEKEAYIDPLQLSIEGAANAVITGNITLGTAANRNYTITIPTKYGELTSEFNVDTLKAVEDYFKGNPQKNAFIKAHFEGSAEDKKKIKFFILAKELGDTLQVQWVNKIIATTPATYNKGNTVVTTNDTVVWMRCIINNVPVIFTNSGKTNYYRAMEIDATARAFIVKSFIDTIRKDVIGQNEAIIQTIEKVIKSAESVAPSGNWVNDNSNWKTSKKDGSYPIENAVTYLLALVTKLKNVNKDLDLQISLQNSVDDAKKLAAKSHFQNPFTYYKSGAYYKTNNKVAFLMDGSRINFKAASFTPSIFTQIPVQALFQTGGGRGRQRGGARKLIAAKIANIIAQRNLTDEKINTLLGYALEEFGEISANLQTIPPEIVGKARSDVNKTQAAVAEISTGDFARIEELWYIWSNNVDTQSNPIIFPNKWFLFIFVQEFFPELFVYASMMKSALEEILNALDVLPAASKAQANVRDKISRVRETNNTFDGVSIHLKTNNIVSADVNDDLFQLTSGSPGEIESSFQNTLKSIVLANYLRSKFPFLFDFNLTRFLVYFTGQRNVVSHLALYPTPNLTDVEIIFEYEGGGQRGGGKERLDLLSSLAIDNYEVYYSLAKKAAYEDRDVTDEEFQAALVKVEEELISTAVLSSPLRIKEKPPTTPGISSNQLKRIQMKTRTPRIVSPIMPQRLVFAGGKTKYKKTQKKRKSSRKQTKRKTRRHKK